ncbi:MAG: carboxylating nicotinate-nucleotide diphosphorylase [Desulfobacterales bacterium]|nr:carboxylating nicotinate-nucleotide diphosphorylase [Desulfobacterales bacterium]
MQMTIKKLIEIALTEDIGPGDITTENLVDPAMEGHGILTAKEPLMLAGLDIARQVFTFLNPEMRFSSRFQDGDWIEKGTVLLEIDGQLRTLLMGERTALNFLQHLSGIATYVHEHVKELGNSKVRLVDIRKTTPGLRVVEKYAVRIGGAYNHRMGLYDGVLIKENHIATCGGITKCIERIRQSVSHLIKIEIEVCNLAEAAEAVAAGAEVILLDNMDLQGIQEAVALIGGKALIEVSGGIKKKDLKTLAGAGVDIISMGALTYSARFMDISMKIH